MRQSSRVKYINANVEEIERISKGKAYPVIVDAYHLFNSACSRLDIDHTFDSGQSFDICRKFAEDIKNQCHSRGITVRLIGNAVVSLVGHGREAVFTDELTEAAYLTNGALCRGNKKTGYAIFSSSTIPNHPLLTIGIQQYSAVTKTRVRQLNKNVGELVMAGHLCDATADELAVTPSLLEDRRQLD